MKKFQEVVARAMLVALAGVLALVAGASLAGCAGVSQAVQAYGSVAVTGARAANDTVIEAQKVSMCALPYSAVQRHPEIHPALVSLCGPLVPAEASAK